MITLSANRFLGAFTNLIAYSQVANTTEAGRVGGSTDKTSWAEREE